MVHFSEVSGVNGIYVGEKGSETAVINSSGAFVGGLTGNLTGNVGGNVVGDVTGSVGSVAGYPVISEARTATTTGATTGTISTGSTHVVVTSASANNIIVLPAPVPGVRITIVNGATGYELRTSAPATVSINGGAEANAESAIAANMIIIMECVSATAWIGSSLTAAGVKGVVQVAAA